MAQQSGIKTTLQKLSLIENIPVEFNIDNRRPITFVCPTTYDLFSELDIKIFLTVISLTTQKIKELKLNVNFDTSTTGKIIQGFMGFTDYGTILRKYFLKYIKNSEVVENAIFVQKEKVLSSELDYISDIIQISLGQKEFEEKQESEAELKDSVIGKILQAQKEAEEKLKKVKSKKAKSGKGYSIEEIMLAVSYEFGYSMKDLLNKTYFSLIWHFGFVSRVDAHKLNQMILSSGMSKKKSYSYWLNT
jgi:glutamyl/glutaminyl-tRNA synthetase